jgi:hypothetical protein
MSAAMASAFQENVARPQARATSTTLAMIAARSAGNCAPLQATKAQSRAIAAMHADQRGIDSDTSNARQSAVTKPTCKPAVTKTCTVPVS